MGVFRLFLRTGDQSCRLASVACPHFLLNIGRNEIRYRHKRKLRTRIVPCNDRKVNDSSPVLEPQTNVGQVLTCLAGSNPTPPTEPDTLQLQLTHLQRISLTCNRREHESNYVGRFSQARTAHSEGCIALISEHAYQISSPNRSPGCRESLSVFEPAYRPEHPAKSCAVGFHGCSQ